MESHHKASRLILRPNIFYSFQKILALFNLKHQQAAYVNAAFVAEIIGLSFTISCYTHNGIFPFSYG